MRKIYLLTTEHLECGLWFRDEEDFIVAMNYIAIQAACSPEAVILAFILMSNHIHIVLRGSRTEVIDFVNQFKRRYSQYYRQKYGTREFLRGNGLDVQAIPLEDEAPERVIAYVQMNCVSANICAHPSQYPWGSGNCFFNPDRPAGKRMGDLSVRARRQLLRSANPRVPEDWLVSEKGYILPSSYVDVRAVESCFRTPKRMNYFLNNSSKARKRIEKAEAAFRDQSILVCVPDLCRSLFQKGSFRELQGDEKVEFARQIRFRFSADATQIARVCGITYAEAAALLDRV